jgi:hypothetical protein
MHPIVISAILEFFFDSPTHLKNKLRSNGYVTQVKKTMYISAHQNPILDFVLPSLTVRKNVGCLKCRKGALTSDSTPSPVVVCHEHTKGTLA